MLLKTSRIKRIIAVVVIAMFLHSAAYPAQDVLRLPVGRQDTYEKISSIYNVFDNATYNYNSSPISLFRYIHEKKITLNQLESAMRYTARLCADGNKSPIIKEDMPILEKRIGLRQVYHELAADYKADLPELEKFITLERNVRDREIVSIHGDFSPQNIIVDPWTGEPAGMINAEASSIGTRSEEIAGFIVSLLDSRKNNPLLIKHFYSMLSTFLSEYFKESGADQDAVLSSIPYYLAIQLLWSAEDTRQTSKRQEAWIKWRIELCKWALSQNTFSVDSLKNFIEKETKDNHINKQAGEISITDKSYPYLSGEIFKGKIGQGVKFSASVVFDKPFKNYISLTNIGVEFWTNANTGIWHAEGSLVCVGYRNGRIQFSGELPIIEASGDRPYEVTAVVSFNLGAEKEDVHFIKLSDGNNAQIRVDSEPASQDNVLTWKDSLDTTYRAVMLDFDGTINFYLEEVPENIKTALIDILNKGVDVAINSSRDDGADIGHFFAELKEKAKNLGKDFDLSLCHVYLKSGKYGYNVRTGEVYYKTFFPEKSKGLVKKLFEEADVLRFLEPNTYRDDEYHIAFNFRGGINREVFAKKLNEKLETINKNLSENEQVVALYTEDFFEISTKQGTKAAGLSDFSARLGVPTGYIIRIGDQGQLYGIDWPMIDSPGGKSVYYVNPGSKYPMSALEMINKRNADATAYLLRNLKISPKISPLQEIFIIQEPVTATQL